MSIHKQKVVVGLSGGVDSAVSALLLKQQGYDVTGIYMQNFEPANDDPYCTGEQDLTDARAVCDFLDIEFQLVNFAKEYWDRVFQHCLDEFSQGRTPNPDIGCNKEIKFNVFLQYVKQLGADFLATGHYVRKQLYQGSYQLCKGCDTNKDQSYFLYTLNQERLKSVLFPLGELTKTAVRKLAKSAGLPNHAKKDSTGICFIGERKFKQFLQEYLLAQPGDMQTPEGHLIGKHDGLMFYTLGQRKGLNIGGQANTPEDAWYVVDKDIPNNKLIVAQGHDHPLLFSQQLTCHNIHWVNNQPPLTALNCQAKIRYRQPDQACQITTLSKDSFEVIFQTPQRAVTPGQSIVFYQADICLGGGIIKNYIQQGAGDEPTRKEKMRTV